MVDKKQFKEGKMYSDLQLRDTFHRGEGEAGTVAGGGGCLVTLDSALESAKRAGRGGARL